MAHLSHAYPDGCSIYFTFAGTANDAAAAERVYDAIWRDGLEAATRVGATISHHHGVGLLKAPYMAGEHREAIARHAQFAQHELQPELKDLMDDDEVQFVFGDVRFVALVAALQCEQVE